MGTDEVKHGNKGRLIRWGIFGLVALAIGWLIILADRDALPVFLARLYDFPYGDKIGHFLLMGLLAFAANLLLPMKSIGKYRLPVFLGSLLVLVFATLEEISQLAFQARTFSLLDLGFSYLGIGVAEIVSRWGRMKNRQRTQALETRPQDGNYEKAQQRNLGLLKNGLDLGTHGKITGKRDDLHDR